MEKSTWVRPKTKGMTTAARTDRVTATSPGSFALTHAATFAERLGRTGVGGVLAVIGGTSIVSGVDAA